MQGLHGEWRSLVAHSAGGRAVAGSNPVSPMLILRWSQDQSSRQIDRRGSSKGLDPVFPGEGVGGPGPDSSRLRPPALFAAPSASQCGGHPCAAHCGHPCAAQASIQFYAERCKRSGKMVSIY